MSSFIHSRASRRFGLAGSLAAAVGSVLLLGSLEATLAGQAPGRTFASPDEAVQALAKAARAAGFDEMLAIFGPEGRELIATSDPATARMNQQVFTVAFSEGWRLVDESGGRKTLVIGNEEWPFPVPLVRQGGRWRFDTAAGKEEVIARRIGRNELQAIAICQQYVAAQLRYALVGHDGKPAGLYAQAFRSDPGRQNGLYWPVKPGENRSPLGDLVAQASAEGRSLENQREPSPFNGYYFKILTGQGKDADGGAKSYLVDGNLSGGFALIAWPAYYNVSGVMTFIVNQDAVIRERDLGPETDSVARATAVYAPDSSWAIVQ
jgi:hypothetical protein